MFKGAADSYELKNFKNNWGCKDNTKIPLNQKFIDYLSEIQSDCFIEWLVKNKFIQKDIKNLPYKLGDKFTKKRGTIKHQLIFDGEYVMMLNLKTFKAQLLSDGVDLYDAIIKSIDDGKFKNWKLVK